MIKQKSRFKRRVSFSGNISTGPMADISFLLIIFFMVSTAFVVYRGFPVNLPEAGLIDSSGTRRNTINVWVSPSGNIMVDQYKAEINVVNEIISRKIAENPRAVVHVRADRDTEFRIVSRVIDELKKANALRVAFIAQRE